MIEKYLWLTGSAIFLILGTIHLLYTFFTGKFNARNEEVITAMKNTSPVLTKETTMWKAWIGFNASHSSGAIFFWTDKYITGHPVFPNYTGFAAPSSFEYRNRSFLFMAW